MLKLSVPVALLSLTASLAVHFMATGLELGARRLIIAVIWVLAGAVTLHRAMARRRAIGF